MSADRSGEWALVIDPPREAPDADAYAPLLGLTPPLRLALTAQAAGARAVVLGGELGRDERRRLLADPRLFLEVLDAAEERRCTLVHFAANTVLHAATTLEAAGRATAPPPFPPILVIDAASRRAAEKALLASLRKPQDGWTSTRLNRPISLRLTRRLVATSLTPNQISLAILAVGLLGGALAAKGTYAAQLAGALLFHAQSVLDGCDGEMSRLTFRQSRLGEWLDTIGDDLTNYGFFAGASWGLYTATGRAAYVAVGLFIVLAGVVASSLEYRYLWRIGSGDLLRYPLGVGKAPGPKSQTFVGRAVDAVSPLFKRDTFVLLTLVGAALGCLGPFLLAFAVGAAMVLAAVVRAEKVLAHQPSRQVDPIAPGD